MPLVSQQIYYSLQARDAESELVPIALDQGLGIMVWSPLAGGLLSGKYRRGQPAPEGTRHLQDWGEPPVHDQDKLYDTIEVLVDIAAARSVSPAEVALAWLLTRPAVTTVVIGARTEEQLATNLRAAELTLSAAELERLDDVSLQPLLYPLLASSQYGRAPVGRSRSEPDRAAPEEKAGSLLTGRAEVSCLSVRPLTSALARP